MKNNSKFEQLFDVVNNNYDDNSFNVDSFMDKCTICPDSVRDTLNLRLNITPFQLIQNIRIEKSLYFLRENIKIKDVFRKVGYSSSRSFRNVFKKRVGIAPSEFKNRVYANDEIDNLVLSLWKNNST